MPDCSEDFEDAFSDHCGGSVRTCSCGITWFDGSSPGHFDKGELEDLLEKESLNGGDYRNVDYSISTMTINSGEVVMGCSCNTARKYEEFLIRDGAKIAEYLNKRAVKLIEKAESIMISS